MFPHNKDDGAASIRVPLLSAAGTTMTAETSSGIRPRSTNVSNSQKASQAKMIVTGIVIALIIITGTTLIFVGTMPGTTHLPSNALSFLKTLLNAPEAIGIVATGIILDTAGVISIPLAFGYHHQHTQKLLQAAQSNNAMLLRQAAENQQRFIEQENRIQQKTREITLLEDAKTSSAELIRQATENQRCLREKDQIIEQKTREIELLTQNNKRSDDLCQQLKQNFEQMQQQRGQQISDLKTEIETLTRSRDQFATQLEIQRVSQPTTNIHASELTIPLPPQMPFGRRRSNATPIISERRLSIFPRTGSTSTLEHGQSDRTSASTDNDDDNVSITSYQSHRSSHHGHHLDI